MAKDGFSGFKTATEEELPPATPVMDPFHVARLAGDALTNAGDWASATCTAHRGRKNDPLYRARRTLHTGADLVADKQHKRVSDLFATDDHVQVEAT